MNQKPDTEIKAIAAQRLAQIKAKQVLAVDYSKERLEDFMVRINPRLTRPLHLGRALDVLNDIVQGKRVRLLWSVPPRHGKSFTVLHLIAQILSLDPTKRIGYITYGEGLSIPHSRKLREICVQAGIELSKEAKAAEYWKTAAGGEVTAVGIGGAIMGRGFDLVIVDDPYKSRPDVESALIRLRTQDFFDSAIASRLEPGASIIVIHTRYHPEDLIGELSKRDEVLTEVEREGWEYVNFPALDEWEEDGETKYEALWPERYSVESLLKIRARNEYEWASMYQGQPRPRGGAVFNDVQYYDTLPEGRPDKICIGIDLAYTAKSYADYSVAVTAALYGDKIYILNVRRKQVELRQFASELISEKTMHPSAPIFWYVGGIEKSHSQTLLNYGVYVRTEVAKADKFVRATPVATAWNHRRVMLPHDAPWLKDFLDEVLSFTGNGDRHDDQVDALAAAYHLLGYRRVERGVGQKRILAF